MPLPILSAGPIMKYVIIIVVILAVVGGFWFFIDRQLAAKDEIIEEQQNKITKLENTVSEQRMRIVAQDSSIQSLNKDIERRIDELKNERERIERLRIADKLASDKINILEQRLNDAERVDRIKRIKQEKPELLINLMNSAVECRLENFARTGGECVGGRWRDFKK